MNGKARFSTQGSANVPAGQLSVLVSNPAVTSASHISITLVTDPGDRSVRWVERLAGGFRLHLTHTQPKNRPATDFTYLITEPV